MTQWTRTSTRPSHDSYSKILGISIRAQNHSIYSVSCLIRAIFVWPWKMVSVSVRYFFYQPMDEKIKTWTFRFPTKENPKMEKALANCVKSARVCVCSINQSNSCITVRLLFLFCSHVFISRSYENRSNKALRIQSCLMSSSKHRVRIE